MAFIFDMFKKFYSLYELEATQFEGVEFDAIEFKTAARSRRLQRLREYSKADATSDTVEEAY